MTTAFDPIGRLDRALHPLAVPPDGPGWNRPDLLDLLPPEFPLRPAPLAPPDGPHVLLTRRTDALRHHGGQVAFPGGRIEDTDADPVAAALREAHEEVGLAPALASPRGYLDPFVTITGFHVFPVVATVRGDYTARPDPSEVAEAFEVPLPFVLDPANVAERDIEWQGRRRRLLEFHWGAHHIWGATAAMLVNFRRRLEDAG